MYLRLVLSKKTKYGIKALTFLARCEESNPVQISEISKKENISHKFLESILLTLKKAGLLGSKKGKGGGYYLRKHPTEIKMTEVIRVLEGPIARSTVRRVRFGGFGEIKRAVNLSSEGSEGRQVT